MMPALFLFFLYLYAIEISLIYLGCIAAKATGLGFVCFVVLSTRVLSANRIDLGFFFVS